MLAFFAFIGIGIVGALLLDSIAGGICSLMGW